MSIRSLNDDVLSSLNAAQANSRALDVGLFELHQACAGRRWIDIEAIRAKMLAAVDGYVDNYAAACKRLEAEGIGRG